VNSTTFGLLFNAPVDGKIDAQPLYLSSVSICGVTHNNVLYVVTENDSIYAFDAGSGAQLWKASALLSGETAITAQASCPFISPTIGITATPVIDRSSGPDGTIYLVAASMNSSGTNFQRLHALDITTGAEEFGGPITIAAQYPGTGECSSGGYVIFDPAQYAERAGLLLLNSVIYTSWTSHCDDQPYTG
jgi:outer membrane protein assembly factor BamB